MSNSKYGFTYAYIQQGKYTVDRKLNITISLKKLDEFISFFWDYIYKNYELENCSFDVTKERHRGDFYQNKSLFHIKKYNIAIGVFFILKKGKGLIEIIICSKKIDPSLEYNHEIITGVIENIKNIEKKKYLKDTIPKAVGQVILKSYYPLHTIYVINEDEKIVIAPLNDRKIECKYGYEFLSTLDFYLYENSKVLQNRELLQKRDNIISALCLITHNLFFPLEYGIYSISEAFMMDSISDRDEPDFYFNDVNMFKLDIFENVKIIEPFSPELSEVIESSSIINEGMRLPLHTLELMNLILKNKRYLNSSKRIEEAMHIRFRDIDTEDHIGIRNFNYILIACISAIESLIDSKPKNVDIECPECGAVSTIQKSEVTKKFNEFIDKYLGQSHHLNSLFKKIYKDRSAFVHAAKDLYKPYIRGYGPIMFEDGNPIDHMPQYTHNLVDFCALSIRKFLYQQIDSINID